MSKRIKIELCDLNEISIVVHTADDGTSSFSLTATAETDTDDYVRRIELESVMPFDPAVTMEVDVADSWQNAPDENGYTTMTAEPGTYGPPESHRQICCPLGEAPEPGDHDHTDAFNLSGGGRVS